MYIVSLLLYWAHQTWSECLSLLIKNAGRLKGFILSSFNFRKTCVKSEKFDIRPGMILTHHPDNPTVQNVPFSSPFPHPSTRVCSSGRRTVFFVILSLGLVFIFRLLERMKMSRSQDASTSEASFQAVRLPELSPWRHRWWWLYIFTPR